MKYRASIALAIAACLSSQANADAGFNTLTVSDFSITAIDLTPDDGITAGYEILPEGWITYAAVNSTLPHNGFEQQAQPGFLSPVSLDLSETNPNTHSIAQINSTGMALHVNGSGDNFGAIAEFNLTNQGPNIRLAPGTGIVVSGNYVLNMSTSNCAWNCGTVAELSLLADGLYGIPGETSFHELVYGATNESKSLTGVASINYRNDTDDYVNMALRFHGMIAIAAVPEPGSIALVTAGMMAAFWARRKKSHRG